MFTISHQVRLILSILRKGEQLFSAFPFFLSLLFPGSRISIVMDVKEHPIPKLRNQKFSSKSKFSLVLVTTSLSQYIVVAAKLFV